LGVRINPTAQFKLATHVRRFKILDALDVVRIAHKVNTREELFQRILTAAKSINNAAVVRKVTILWSHESENVSKPMEDTSNNLLER